MNEFQKKIVLTGGHAGAVALAIVQEIQSQGLNWKLFWLGPKQALEGKKSLTLEARVLPKLGVTFYPMKTGRLQIRWSRWTIPSAIKIPYGFLEAYIYLRKIKPNIIVSLGGYAAFPVVVIARLLGVPVVVNEQTASVGRANKFSSFFANKISLARAESKPFFPKDKTVVVGLPIQAKIYKVKVKDTLSNPLQIQEI